MQPAVAGLTSVIKRQEVRKKYYCTANTQKHTYTYPEEKTGYLLARRVHKVQLSSIFNILKYKLKYTRGILFAEDCPTECERPDVSVCTSTIAGRH
jgi:hypothetical protein